jgi:amino acid permease
MLGVLLLPLFFELDGIWFSVLAAEILAFVTTLAFLFANRKKYKYM